MIAGLRSFFGSLLRSARIRIIMTALAAGAVCGALGVGEPLDDAFYALRTILVQRPSDGQIALVAVDDRTLGELGTVETPRTMDAQVIDAVLGSGAKRIYFDRSYRYASDDAGDNRLIESLKRWKGRVFFGAIYQGDGSGQQQMAEVPHDKFLPYVEVVSLMGRFHPFGLGISLYYSAETPHGRIPSMSASIANLDASHEGTFRPDFLIDHTTYPHYSFIDVARGTVPRSAFAGKDVIIAPTSYLLKDLHRMPPRGFMEGSLLHAMGAETLKEGVPLSLGWLPLLLVAVGVLATGMKRGRSMDVYRLCGMAAAILILPVLLDHLRMEFEVFPAFVALSVGVFRARSLDKVEQATDTNPMSGLPTVKLLRNQKGVAEGSLVALKIRNYAGIIGTFAEEAESQIANEIVRRIRISEPEATVYHEGGQFLWLSTIKGTLDLCENLEGLHRIVQNGVRVAEIDIDLAFNCGVDPETGRPMASRVASAMQSAEEAGRNDELVCVFDSRKHEAQWEISLLSQLDRAIDNGEVWVAYQPKLDLRTGRITGAEALVRWTHPERGPISPEKFIGIAEEYHRIERVTSFVINDAVRTATTMLRDGHDFSVAVNISAQLLRNPALPAMITEILQAYGLPPRRLVLEITETDRLDRSSRTFDMLRDLVASGLTLSIDDFGTGNATIDYLRYLPAQEVKIDQIFVSNIEHSREDYLLVQSILEMAHSLGRTVVAEGVETRGTLEMLSALGCDVAQGYHVGAPVPFREFRATVNERIRLTVS